jgi:hypothetical protein
VEYQEEEAGVNKPFFHRGLHLRSNFLDMDDEEPLFVMEIATEERYRARRLPNRNGECNEANIIAI